MRDWLLHMTEAQRTYAVGLIDAVLDRIGTPFDAPPARWANWTQVTVHGLADRRSGVRVVLSRGTVILRTPLSPKRDRFAAELTGPACTPMEAGAGDIGVMIATLVKWRAALAAPVTAATTAQAEEMESAAIRLVRGVVHAHRPDWEMATLGSCRDDGHVLSVYSREPNGSQLGRRFTDRPAIRTGSGMTLELVAEIDRMFGGHCHAHVVELERWKRYRLCFDATPTYCVSPTRDPMTMMRALNALPPGARLMSGP